MPEVIEQRLLSVKQVAEYLGVTPNTCYRMVRKGSLVPVKIEGLGRVLFDKADIDQLIEESKAKSNEVEHGDIKVSF